MNRLPDGRGCPDYAIEGGSRCRTHHAEFEAQRRADPNLTGRRGSDPQWRRARGLSLWRHHYRCQACGIGELELKANDDPPLEVHHINGDSTEHRQSNLRVLCHKCHKGSHDRTRTSRL